MTGAGESAAGACAQAIVKAIKVKSFVFINPYNAPDSRAMTAPDSQTRRIYNAFRDKSPNPGSPRPHRRIGRPMREVRPLRAAVPDVSRGEDRSGIAARPHRVRRGAGGQSGFGIRIDGRSSGSLSCVHDV